MVGQIRTTWGSSQPAKDWIGLTAELKAAQKELSDFESIMTPYERSVNSRSIKERKDAYFQAIYSGAAAEIQGAIDDYKAAQRRVETEKMHEIARWDAGRLASEMQIFQMRLDQAISAAASGGGLFGRGQGAAERIQNLYTEARASGDMYKQRAAAEILQAVTGDNKRLSGDALVKVRVLASEAQQELAALRAPDSLRAARRAEQKAAEDAIEARELVAQVGEALGEPVRGVMTGGAFANLIKRVQYDPETGALQTYELTDSQVTGIHWSKSPEDMVREAEEREGEEYDNVTK